MRPLLLDTCAVLRLANGEFRKFSDSTMKAMREAEEIANNPDAETYETVEDLFKAAEA